MKAGYRVVSFVRLMSLSLPFIGILFAVEPTSAKPGGMTIVALGASQTFGKGVSREEAFPAQLEMLLRAAGHNVRVINAGINGETTEGMLGRMNTVLPKGTKIVILQPGGNDKRMGMMTDREGNISQIESPLTAQSIQVIMLENSSFRGMPRAGWPTPYARRLSHDSRATCSRRGVPYWKVVFDS